MSQLDAGQIIKTAYDDAKEAIKVSPVTGTIVSDEYDEIDLTYVASGNGVGEIETVVYKLAGATVATLNLTYNSDNKLTAVVKS